MLTSFNNHNDSVKYAKMTELQIFNAEGGNKETDRFPTEDAVI